MKTISTMKSKIGNNLAVVIKQMRGMIASLFTISMILAPWGTATAADAVKWHPGHYYELERMGKYSPDYMKKVYNEITQTQALRGIVVRYGWGELEKSKDVYDFSSINKLLTELTARKKRLIILLETKSSTTKANAALAPDYIKTAAYDGGTYTFSAGRGTAGHGLKLWNLAVHDRKAKLISELGKRFNSNPYFEGIGYTETSLGQVSLSTTTVDKHYKNLLSLNKKLRASFPNTMTFQYTNYPRPIVKTYIDTFKQTGTALGCPDVFLDDKGLTFQGDNPGVYTYYPKLSGTLPLVVQVEKANYMDTRHDGTGYQPSIAELLNYARDNLKVNYIFWVRSLGYYPKVLSVLEQQSQTRTSAGGLKSACPSVYPSCVQ
ncbi:hypothetical protein C8R34_1483 [Nitrosomonas sp. Nm84]|uniref:glycoside hydrolase n=1 Tax=Nitrosomonas sp. Nm84 TaxID=200124 RepID=UPI000D764564|nr:glycoside hydrolase [Nitrosomonas sp. Nm84]PXW80421.1 hypothetical protein C8R34_1483 [Nitrosomonas sp. Nm84]